MNFLMKAAKKKDVNAKLRPGTYTAEIISVAETKGYKPGDAYTLVYDLSDGDKSWSYSEIFISDPDDSRTAIFADYLSDNGIEITAWNQLVGLREEVQLLKESKGKRGVFLNIVERRILV